MDVFCTTQQDGLCVVVEGDGEGAFAALRTLDFNHRLQVVFQATLCGGMGRRQFAAAAHRCDGGFFGGFHHLFGLVHREVTVDDGVQNLEVTVNVLDVDQRTGVSHADFVGA